MQKNDNNSGQMEQIRKICPFLGTIPTIQRTSVGITTPELQKKVVPAALQCRTDCTFWSDKVGCRINANLKTLLEN